MTTESRLSYSIFDTYKRAIWEKLGRTSDPPSYTPEQLWEWMPPFHPDTCSKFIPSSLVIEEQFTTHDLDEPITNWNDKAWLSFIECFFIHSIDLPSKPTAQEDEFIGRLNALAGMYLFFKSETINLRDGLDRSHWDIHDAIEAIYKLWKEVDDIYPGQFTFPLAPIIEAWLAEQIPTANPEQRPSQIAPSFLKDSRIAKTNPLLPVGQIHTQAPQTPMLPGFEPEGSALVPALPLEIYGTGPGSGRGAPLDERIWMNALIALPFGERDSHGLPGSVRLETTLRDIKDWLYPNGWTRTRQLPLIREALFNVHNKRITYERRDWSVVQVLALPNPTTKLDDPLPFTVRLPDGVRGNGPMIDVEKMRLYGTKSAPKFRAWIRLAYLWDEAKKQNGGHRIYNKIPKVLRNQQGFLTYPNGDLILSSKPKKGKDGKWQAGNGKAPQKAWYHPWATRIGEIDNPQTDKVPVLTNSDLVALFYNESEVNRTTFDNRVQEAKHAALSMQADGNVKIDTDAVDPKRGVKGWRIIQVRKQKNLESKT